MRKIEVRLAEKSDLDQLAKIQVSSWKSAFSSILTPDILNIYTDTTKCKEILNNVLDTNRGHLYIASLNDMPCGELFWCEAGQDMPQNAHIIALHSLETSWGTGLGHAIMKQALLDIKLAGKSIVSLWVFKDNCRARKFYEKCGFTYSGREQCSDFGNVIEIEYIKHL